MRGKKRMAGTRFVLLYIWLVERVAWVFWTNHRAWQSKPMQSRFTFDIQFKISRTHITEINETKNWTKVPLTKLLTRDQTSDLEMAADNGCDNLLWVWEMQSAFKITTAVLYMVYLLIRALFDWVSWNQNEVVTKASHNDEKYLKENSENSERWQKHGWMVVTWVSWTTYREKLTRKCKFRFYSDYFDTRLKTAPILHLITKINSLWNFSSGHREQYGSSSIFTSLKKRERKTWSMKAQWKFCPWLNSTKLTRW